MDTAHAATPVMLILSICIVFGRVLTILNIPQTLTDYVVGHVEANTLVLLVINLFLLFAGMIMDTVPCILILAPIMLPIVKQYGVDPIHFSIVMTVNLLLGFVTPPMNKLICSKFINKDSYYAHCKTCNPVCVMFLVALGLITYIPEITMFLPKILSVK